VLSVMKKLNQENDDEMIDSWKEAERMGDACLQCNGNPDAVDFTPEEVEKFPLEMRCCFHLQGWNKLIHPQSIDEWAELIGWLNYNVDACFYKCAVRKAKETARKLGEFVKRTIDLERYT